MDSLSPQADELMMEELSEEDLIKLKEMRDLQLNALAASMVKMRQEAIDGRKQSGIESDWEEDEEFYEGIDDSNRNEIRVSWGLKPSTINGSFDSSRDKKQATRSNAFLNITRPYVDAAGARVGDMLYPTDDRSWGIKPTPVPEEIDVAADEYVDQAPDDKILEAAIEVEQKIEEIEKKAKKKAEKAQTQIDDWLVECQYHGEGRKLINDSARIGTGVLKGPVPVKCSNGEIQPESRRVDPWNAYPDPACGENIQNGRYFWERERMTAGQLRKLREDPTYLADQIEEVLSEGPARRVVDGVDESPVGDSEQYDVWHGYADVPVDGLSVCGCPTEHHGDDVETISAIVTIINERIVKAAESYVDGFPYDFIPWQQRRGSPWGIGVARQMRTPQRMLNAAARNMLDNAGLSAGPQLVIMRGAIEPANGKWELAPRKIWYGKEDADIQDVDKAFRVINIPTLQAELMNITQFSMKMAEDATGFPMIMQGQQGAAPDTVGGMQMLDNNANTVLRRLARNFDDYVTEPHIRRYYDWIMRYGPEEAQGDAQVDARGSSALVERSIQNQGILQMGSMVNNPAFGISPEKWMKEWLKSQRLDPSAFQYDEEEKQKLAENQQPNPDIMKLDLEKQVAEQKHQIEQMKMQGNLQVQQARLAMERELKMMDMALKRDLTLAELQTKLKVEAQNAQIKQIDQYQKSEIAKQDAGLRLMEQNNRRMEANNRSALREMQAEGRQVG